MVAFRETLEATCSLFGMTVLGVVDEEPSKIALLGLAESGWDIFSSSAEYRDGAADPLDRWSKRTLTQIAKDVSAIDVRFPFTGPPYEPFIGWALDSGETFSSPAGMLVHHRAGFWISFRGALFFDRDLEPLVVRSPCDTCIDQPCRTACPVDALSVEHGYNVDACHAFLDTKAGQDCLIYGCKARRSCPVGQRFGRDPEQSAFHMKSFHPT